MKNVLIMGVARAGKTTLSNMIKNKFPQCNVIHADSIVWGIIRGIGKEEYYTKNVTARKELVHSQMFQRIILEIYKSSIKQDTQHYGTVLETGQLEPKYIKEVLQSDNLECVCLGHGDLDKKGIMDLCRKYDRECDWTYKIPEENLAANAEKWDEKNKLLRTECPKYGIEYIDTSNNRQAILSEILERIGKDIVTKKEINIEEDER